VEGHVPRPRTRRNRRNEATMRSGGGELALVAAQDELVSPSRKILPKRL
jgi:hypothetical protein